MSAGWLWVTRGEMDELIWVEPVLLPRLVTLTLGPGVCDSLRGSGDPWASLSSRGGRRRASEV